MIRLYNTLTKKIDDFKPLKTDFVRQYDCGPTVYFYAHIGNMWRYLISDLLRRVLEYNGYQVKQVMNITDVGHLTEDDLAADTGEDKMEVAAKKEKKTPQQIAEFYTQTFLKDIDRLNILRPQVMPKATEHIKAIIKIISLLEKKGYVYWAGDKYFVYDIAKFKNYGKLSGKKLNELKAGSRLEPVPGKRDPFDFALWIKDSEHLMHWDSPWGVGYPGWHIECSAMSMEYLGPTLDIHTGGEDNIFPHHENEIAQSEAATGKQFVRYWVHIRHSFVNGQKMSKSKGNIYTLQDLIDKGFDPLAYRYLCLNCHYRKNLNFTWDSLASASKALEKLKEIVRNLYQKQKERTSLGEEYLLKVEKYRDRFQQAVNNDLGLPEALAVAWEMVKSDVPSYDKLELIKNFDEVLGLDLIKKAQVKLEIPEEIEKMREEREGLRKANQWQKADELRKKIETQGFILEDTPQGAIIKKK